MRRSIGIFWKYFMAYSAMVTIVILVLVLLMNATIQDRYQEVVINEMKRYVPFAVEGLKSAFDEDIDRADELADRMGKQTDARITFIAPDGVVLGDSERDPAEMENHADRPEIQEAISGSIGESTRYSTTIEEKMTYFAVPVLDGGEVKGVVRVSLRADSVGFLARMITGRLILLSIIIWAVALVLTLLFSSIFSSSVNQLVDLTKRLAKGDFTKRANARRQDELGELAIGLNNMSRQLQSLFSQLQSKNDELNAIISSMTEGLLVLDDQLRVRLANKSLKQMFAIKGAVVGRSYIEVIRAAAFKEMVEELVESGGVEHRRMELENRIIMGNGVILKGEDDNAESYVLVFHDITLDVQLENIKAEFAANASHELRTPLSAIKGYLETFEEEDPEIQKSFIQIIRRNVDRISNLVSDLLFLSRLEETPRPELNFTRVELLSIAGDVMKLMERLTRDKDIELKMDIKPDVAVMGDPFLLEQMLMNLLDNAVKYTEHGSVTLRASRTADEVIIQVADTGIGIPSEHIPRIFERFYRVDKARSRKLGGTGLGLSIVKHIIQLHGGSIDVESRSGSGTTFNIHMNAA